MGQLVGVGIEAKPTKRIGWCLILECQDRSNLDSFCKGIAAAEAGQQKQCPRKVGPHFVWLVVAMLV
jgi:hypothetical protein